ncbi:hypothetical protein SAMN06273572_11125 [Monaibacterium marinum]|uniref:Uncharacterized protein n=1 Tax=Pontivivens marinum TaxID=1690039 RepID=A0A2C9CVQ1_9RHOB|nr:hypothetical protein SAMN06273572_11125 [Monaibacterium marinum]
MKSIYPAIAGVLLVVAAIPVLTSELGAVLGAGHSQSTRMQAMESGRPRVGLSTDSHKRALDLCIDTISDVGILQADEAQRQAILTHCETQADHALAHAPSDSFIWWVKAVLEIERGNIPDAFTALEYSRQTAPYELWIALRRARLDERIEVLQTETQQALGQDADLLVLAQSRRGVGRLAQRYLSDEQFRNRIVGLIETLTPAEQRRFLRNVRNIGQGLQG